MDREASALGILPGTHRAGTLAPHEQYFDEPSFHNAATGEAFQCWRIPSDHIDFSREVVLPMSPGDAAFFTNHTWHRAEPNRMRIRIQNDHRFASKTNSESHLTRTPFRIQNDHSTNQFQLP